MSTGTQGYSDLMADPKERFDIVNGKQIALLVAPVLCFVLASIAVAARWYTRSVRRVNTLWEDGLCLAALVRWRHAQRLRKTDTLQAMSFCVVTLVYILVFLCGEGLTSEQIKADPTRNYDEVKRYWLRVRSPHRKTPCPRLTTGTDAIRTRYLLGNIRRNRTALLHPVLCSTLLEQDFCTRRLLRLHGIDCYLVHLVACRLDQHVPPTWEMRVAKQEVMHYHRLPTRLLQRHHPLRTYTGCHRRPSIQQEKSLDDDTIPTGMLVSPHTIPLTCPATDTPKLYHPRRSPHRLCNQRLRRRRHRPNRRFMVARLLLSHRNRRGHRLLLRPPSFAVPARAPLAPHRRHRSETPQVPNHKR
jgi:hypothetical protein